MGAVFSPKMRAFRQTKQAMQMPKKSFYEKIKAVSPGWEKPL